MREILFRGKRTDNGEWAYGNLTIWGDETVSVDDTGWAITPCYTVDPETVGQYTGLTDKNGKKIFEGDICDFCIGERCHSLVEVSIRNCCVGFEPLDYDSVHPDDQKWQSFWLSDEDEMWDSNYFSVVGNIHDNPDLLKGEQA